MGGNASACDGGFGVPIGVAEKSWVKLATAGSGDREEAGWGAGIGGLTGSADGEGAGVGVAPPSVEKSCVNDPGAAAAGGAGAGGAAAGGAGRTGSIGGALTG